MARILLIVAVVTVLAGVGAFVAGRATREEPRAPDAGATAITVEPIETETWELVKPSLPDLVTPAG